MRSLADLLLIGLMALNGGFEVPDLIVAITKQVAEALGLVYGVSFRIIEIKTNSSPHCELYIFCILAWFCFEFSTVRCKDEISASN
jgi:hypothetical protein